MGTNCSRGFITSRRGYRLTMQLKAGVPTIARGVQALFVPVLQYSSPAQLLVILTCTHIKASTAAEQQSQRNHDPGTLGCASYHAHRRLSRTKIIPRKPVAAPYAVDATARKMYPRVFPSIASSTESLLHIHPECML